MTVEVTLVDKLVEAAEAAIRDVAPAIEARPKRARLEIGGAGRGRAGVGRSKGTG